MKRVEIIWQDVVTHSELRLLEDARGLSPIAMQVLGYLLEETDKTITLVGQAEVGDGKDRVCADVHVIPKGCIKRIINVIIPSAQVDKESPINLDLNTDPCK